MAMRNSRTWSRPCLTMHQPWASLLVHGIKRVEGRSWPAPLRGRIWIHAAGRVPDAATIQAMEDFYKQIYALDGIHDLQFPKHYPVSRLLGCVEVVGCMKGAELESWEAVPMGVRLEAQTDFCWLCEHPMKLPVPIEMKGNQGVYELDAGIFEAAMRRLVQVKGPYPVNFRPCHQGQFSPNLKPSSNLATSSGLAVAVAAAREAATQFYRKADGVRHNESFSSTSSQRGSYFIASSGKVQERTEKQRKTPNHIERNPSSAIFVAAIRGLRHSAQSAESSL